jgi:ABC-type lipoprotein export system ATPase subunit
MLANASPTGAPVIETRGLTKVYPNSVGGVPVLAGVDMSIAHGEIVALRGPSGSGKSTLLNILGCLDRPTRGAYMLGGSDVSALTREEQAWVRLHYIGFIFQSFHLLGHATALENVTLPLHYAGVPRARSEQMGRELLARVGLSHRHEHFPSQLSGGERQRVAIARALTGRPPVVLADEPTGALDTKTGAEIMRLLLELRDERKTSIILVTHDPEVAEYADRQIFLRDGRVVDRSEVPDGVRS